MKRTILLSAAAVLAATGFAQYSCNPETSALLENGTPSKVWYITLSDTSVEDLTKAGSELVYVGPDADAGRNFWYWNGWVAGPETNPRVGMEDGSYISITVTGEGGWSGGGIAINGPKSETPGAGVDLSALNDDTHFHFAYCTNGTAPSSVAVILLDDEANGSKPAKVSYGESAFNDNGAIYPLISGKITDEWQGVDITIGQLKKLYPTFAPTNLDKWGGNILSMLGGAVPETNFCMDAIYFYNEAGAGVEGVEVEKTLIVVTENTVNAGVNGIQVWNAAGELVAASNGSVCGIADLPAGLYIAKAGNSVKKFVK